MPENNTVEFERDMGCTEAEWLGWLSAALAHHAWQLGQGQAQVQLAEGVLTLRWRAMPPRAMGLVRIPRLGVRYCFVAVPEPLREAFMRRFDLHMHRGGG